MAFIPPVDIDPSPTGDTVKQAVLKNETNIVDIYESLNQLLEGIELLPDSGQEILDLLAPVDGDGSGLDADLLDGKHGSEYALFGHGHDDATGSAAGFMSTADKQKLDSISSHAEENVQSDWNQTASSHDAFIRNKPKIIGTSGFIEPDDTAVFLDEHNFVGKSPSEMKGLYGFYHTTDFMDQSTGAPDANKPVMLNSQGQIDPTMLDMSVFH
jgi:hypothetical protein